MAKLINKTQGFTVVNGNITKDHRLGIKERGLLVTLLSLPDEWDFSVRGLTKILPDGKAAIQSAAQKLEEYGYLRRVQAKADNGKFTGYDWEIIAEPDLNEPLTENQPTVKNAEKSPLTEKPSTEKPSTENQPQLNNKILNTQEVSINQSINQEEQGETPSIDAPKIADRLIDTDTINNIKEQIEYDILLQDYSRDLIDIAVSCIADLYSTTESQNFNSRTYSAEYVRERSLAIDCEHIRYVFDCFEEQREKVYNIRKYLLTAIFNAPDTIGAYYENLVRATSEII